MHDKKKDIETLSKFRLQIDKALIEMAQPDFTNDQRMNLLYNLDIAFYSATQDIGYHSFTQNKRKELQDELNQVKSLITKRNDVWLKGITGPKLAQTITAVSNNLADWWCDHGFVFVSDDRFTIDDEYEFRLGFMLHVLIDAEAKRDAFMKKGIEFPDISNPLHNNIRYAPLDTPNNKKIIEDIILEKFPDARIHSWENLRVKQNDNHILRHIRVSTKDVSTLLPAEK